MSAVGKKSHKLHGKITQTPAKVTALAPEKPVPPAFSGHLAEGLGATIAINAAHYDKLPYISNPFPFSQPCRIGAIAKLFGLTPVDPARARILEIGCASGGNIIPLAARYPMASVVGIDISAVQVEAGCARIAAQGLDNIKFTVPASPILKRLRARLTISFATVFFPGCRSRCAPRFWRKPANF